LQSNFYWTQISESSSGTGQPNVNATKLSELLFPLPPIEEQHRIVQRIETLFAEVDELEEKLNLQTKLDKKLQMAVNAEVQKAPDADASKTAWRFISTNFDTLYHTPEAIDNLKKNILNEAVRGRLVPQDPNDEPASELLKKIEFEKQRLYDEGEIRKPKDLPPVDEEEIPFEIPESWEWCRFGDLASTVEYGTSQKAHKEPNGVPVLRMGNIDENGNMSFDNLKYVNEDIKDLPRLYLKNDDLVFNRTNSYELVGKMGLFKERNEKFTLASYLIRSTLLTDIFPEYIHHYFNSHHCRVNEIEPEITKQTNQANFNGTKLQNVRVPLSAKEEQHRVVQRIEELFAICDRFKAQLEQRQAVNERLVKGLVGEVLEGS
jgi:type I restriction enzyme S subunit